MKKNQSWFLFLGILFLFGTVGSILAYRGGEAASVVVGIAAGFVVVAIDWVARKRGRKPNKTGMTPEGIIIALGSPAYTTIFGGARGNQIAFMFGGLTIPVCLYLMISIFVTARKTPGYWTR